jgi:hypothetical protein
MREAVVTLADKGKDMEEISYTVTKDDLIAWSTYGNMTAMSRGKKWYAGWTWQVLGIILFLAGLYSQIIMQLDFVSLLLLFAGAFLFLLSRQAGSMPSYLTSFLKSSLKKQGAKIF